MDRYSYMVESPALRPISDSSGLNEANPTSAMATNFNTVRKPSRMPFQRLFCLRNNAQYVHAATPS